MGMRELGETEYFIDENGRLYPWDCELSIHQFPADTPEEVMVAWTEGYEKGYHNGYTWGKAQGREEIRTEFQKLFGIYDSMSSLRNDVKTIATALYHHDVICKADVAGIVGRDE